MNNRISIEEFDYVYIVWVCICIIFIVFIILQCLELIRFYNYGKVPKGENINCRECKWWHQNFSEQEIFVPICVRPSIIRKSRKCRGKCNYMRYKNVEPYPKSIIVLVVEFLLLLINFLLTFLAI